VGGAWGRCITPFILNFGTRWRQVVNFMPPTTLRLSKVPLYPLNRWLGEPKSQSGHFEDKRYILSLPGIELCFLALLAYSLVTILTMLSWFLSHSICLILTCQFWLFTVTNFRVCTICLFCHKT
jgi:hypothetical protein